MYEVREQIDGTWQAIVMAQDGWERVTKPTRDLAIDFVVDWARHINHDPTITAAQVRVLRLRQRVITEWVEDVKPPDAGTGCERNGPAGP